MAVGSSTAVDSVRGRFAVCSQRPVRTCIGCRQRASAAELLRVVVAPETTGEATSARGARHSSEQLEHGSVALPVLPDPRRRLPGRGAWLHPDPDCVALAERRRAFGRSFRASVPIDPAAVREYVSQRYSKHDQQDQHNQQDAHRRTPGD